MFWRRTNTLWLRLFPRLAGTICHTKAFAEKNKMVRYRYQVDPGDAPTTFEHVYDPSTKKWTIWKLDEKTGNTYYGQFTIWPPTT